MAVPGEVTDRDRIVTSLATVASGITAHVATPNGDGGQRPGVIVIHEAFGLNAHISDVADRFANAGYDAIAPDLYTRAPLPDNAERDDIFRVMFGMADSQVVADLEACAAHLRSLPTSNGKVGVIGFCSGGRQTLLLAVSSDAVDASVDCWGGFVDRAGPDRETTSNRPRPPATMIDRVRAPLLLVGGADDANPSPEVLEQMAATATTATEAPVAVHIYPDVGHAFFADYRPSYSEPAAHQLWDEVLAFFGQHLR